MTEKIVANKFRVYQWKSALEGIRFPAQLFFLLQHPIIEPMEEPPAQHLVHLHFARSNHHYIYPAAKVSFL